MIEEYISKANLAIDEGFKKLEKGQIDKKAYYHVLEEYFNKIYAYVKENETDIDANTLAKIHSLENCLNDFIIPLKINLEAPSGDENSDTYLLQTIVYFTRKQLHVKNKVNINVDSLKKYDEQANKYVKDMCDRLGLLCYSFNVGQVFDIPKNHNISLVKVNNKFYLIDCTYQQFFLLGQNFKERYLKSASHIVKCEIGARIFFRNKKGAITLLEQGFISALDKMFEDYFITMFDQVGKEPLASDDYLNLIINRKKKK